MSTHRLSILLAAFILLLCVHPAAPEARTARGWADGGTSAPPTRQEYDLIVRGGRVLDGTGNPWYRADVAIPGDRIAAVGELAKAVARGALDASGLYVVPGFIDVHSHAAGGLTSEERSDARALLHQGVTTVVVNPDGGGPVDLAAQRAALLEQGLGVNVAQLVGHGAIRRAVLGVDDRAPTPDELSRMEAMVRASMQEGAFGLSSGLFYVPSSYAETEELIALARVVAGFGGVYASHIRDESDYSVGLVAAVEEAIEIARTAGIPGVVTHVKAGGPHLWGYSLAVVRRIERARAEGVEIYADQYPYEAGSVGLGAALLPHWAQAGGRDALLRRLDDPQTRERIRAAMVDNLARRGGGGRIQVARFREDPSLEGLTLQELAERRGIDPVEAALELIVAGRASIISFHMHPEDIQTFMRQPWTMTSSDGGLPQWNVGKPHPRSYGTFPRKIRKYVLEEGVVKLPFAIRSMTSLPATAFRLADRGTLRPGAFADVVVFDVDRITDRATFAQPHQLSEGIVLVLVNGEVALQDGSPTGRMAGRVVRRAAPTS